LLNVTAEEIGQDRFQAVRMLVEQYGGVCVLKGCGSLVLRQQDIPALCSDGNAGMASGGMGDVLSGVIISLIAQGMPIHDAARLGVGLHARAADLAAQQDGQRGLLATDLIPHLRRLINQASNRMS
jgi:NAD(P)H-hydrate epimerase